MFRLLTVAPKPKSRLCWNDKESVVADVEFKGRTLQSVKFRPIWMNKIGQGFADFFDEHTNNQFLQTSGLPKPATGDQARYILERVAALSKPFGTNIAITGDSAELKLTGSK